MQDNDLQKRLFIFSANTIRLIRKLPISKEYQIISYQLLKSATSAGANYEEAQGAVSKADFSHKISISLKEMKETNYWIRLIIAVLENHQDWIKLNVESAQLKDILGKIHSKTSPPRMPRTLSQI